MGLKSGIYRHYKGGYYLLIGLAQHTENDHVLVIYVSLDAGMPGLRLRARPLYGPDGWNMPVEGKERFEYVGHAVMARDINDERR